MDEDMDFDSASAAAALQQQPSAQPAQQSQHAETYDGRKMMYVSLALSGRSMR